MRINHFIPANFPTGDFLIEIPVKAVSKACITAFPEKAGRLAKTARQLLASIFVALVVFSLTLKTSRALAAGNALNSSLDLQTLKNNVQKDTVILSHLLASAFAILHNADLTNSQVSDALPIINRLITLSDSLHLNEWKYTGLKTKGNYYLLKKDVINGQFFYKQVTDYYHKINHLEKEGDCWVELSQNIDEHAKNSFETKVLCLQRALKLYTQINQPLNAIYCLKAIGDVHLNQGKLGLAEQELLSVLTLYKRNHFKSLQGT